MDEEMGVSKPATSARRRVETDHSGEHRGRTMGEMAGSRHVKPEEQPTSTFGWGAIKFLCDPKVCGSEQITAGHVKLASGQGHLRHNHPGSEEILFIIAGEGEQMVETDLEENGAEPRFFPVKAGDLVHIPASVHHQTVNTGAATMELLAVYSPCGPEAVIRALPDHRELPPGPWPE
jgi:oxalate decarboxylase/phosphoglucose isomerase-like protein (cupin superfamily)